MLVQLFSICGIKKRSTKPNLKNLYQSTEFDQQCLSLFGTLQALRWVQVSPHFCSFVLDFNTKIRILYFET